jgi:uncharacterized membrane protein
MAGAAWFRHRTGIPFAAAANQFAFIRTLPRERREEIRHASREQLASGRPLWQSVREARREADRLLTVEPFDPAAFLTAHRALLEKEGAARMAGSQLLADIVARLTPEERRRMASWRERHRDRWRRGGSGNAEDAGRPPRELAPAGQPGRP